MVKLTDPQSSKLPQPRPLSRSTAWAIALSGGILMGLTPSPANLWPLAWVALAPLWVLVVQPSSSPPGAPTPRILNSGVWMGLIWGVGYHGSALFWITGVHPMTWMGVPWLASLAIALFCWVFITCWGALLVGSWAWSLGRLNRLGHRAHGLTPLTRILVGTALWCALEALWSSGALWWTSLSYTQSPHNLPILHLGQLSGPLTVTAAIVVFNGLLAEAGIRLYRSSKREAQVLLALAGAWLVTLHGLGLWLANRPLMDAPDQALRVGLIQGNIPNTIKLYEEGWRRALQGYTTGYETLAESGVEVVLTPETALPIVWTGPARSRSAFYQAMQTHRVPVWLGAFGAEGTRLSNSLFSLNGDGAIVSEYRKVKLVPLGEYIPFERWVGQFINRLSPLDAQLVPGRPNQVFETPFGRAIAAICYESAFSEVFRHQAAAGGEFIVTASNNAHYSVTMPAQHHAQDVMRAIETDRWAARATNTGYSAIVDPHGKTRWISGINTYEIHADTLYRRQTQTLYVRWGNWLLLPLGAIALLAWGWERVRAG